jgi:hypothetical protein
MRAFVSMRGFALSYGQIIEKLSELDGKIGEHDEALNNILQALKEQVRRNIERFHVRAFQVRVYKLEVAICDLQSQ